MLLAVFELTVTLLLLVKITENEDRLVFVPLTYTKTRKILRKLNSNNSVHSLKMSTSAWPFSNSYDDESLKYGIKVWVCADSTSGYTCEFQVCEEHPPGVKTEVGLGKHAVLELTKKLIGKR